MLIISFNSCNNVPQDKPAIKNIENKTQTISYSNSYIKTRKSTVYFYKPVPVKDSFPANILNRNQDHLLSYLLYAYADSPAQHYEPRELAEEYDPEKNHPDLRIAFGKCDSGKTDEQSLKAEYHGILDDSKPKASNKSLSFVSFCYYNDQLFIKEHTVYSGNKLRIWEESISTVKKNEHISVGFQFKYRQLSDTIRFNQLRDSVFNSVIIE